MSRAPLPVPRRRATDPILPGLIAAACLVFVLIAASAAIP